MKKKEHIFLAFLLNLGFSVLEFVGGLLTGSTAVLSDAVHDLGDAASIGCAWVLERKSRKKPDATHTFGYVRYSVLGGLLTTMILVTGSVLVIANGIGKLFAPTPIHYDGMLLLAVVGLAVNLTAALITRHGNSVNEKAVNLHMLEDVLGWVVVLVGAGIMRFTDWRILDPLLSLAVAVYILLHAWRHFRQILGILLEQTPADTDAEQLRRAVLELEAVEDVHHVHLWSLDGCNPCATMHVVTSQDSYRVKQAVRNRLKLYDIHHVTLELELPGECCHAKSCGIYPPQAGHTGCHHH